MSRKFGALALALILVLSTFAPLIPKVRGIAAGSTFTVTRATADQATLPTNTTVWGYSFATTIHSGTEITANFSDTTFTGYMFDVYLSTDGYATGTNLIKVIATGVETEDATTPPYSINFTIPQDVETGKYYFKITDDGGETWAVSNPVYIVKTWIEITPNEGTSGGTVANSPITSSEFNVTVYNLYDFNSTAVNATYTLYFDTSQLAKVYYGWTANYTAVNATFINNDVPTGKPYGTYTVKVSFTEVFEKATGQAYTYSMDLSGDFDVEPCVAVKPEFADRQAS